MFVVVSVFFFVDSANHFYPESYYEIYRVHVHHTGRVRWWFGGVMETSCHLDGTLFPFDSQSCSIVIESWAYSEAFVDLKNASNYVLLDGFNDDGQLNLVYKIKHPKFSLPVILYLTGRRPSNA